MSSDWREIEMDPELLTAVIQQMQVKGVRVEELYSLDLDCLNELRPIYGLIFLCQWRLPRDNGGGSVTNSDDCPNLYFAKQVLNQAGATQAILSVLLNCPEINIGPDLSMLKAFTNAFPPDLKGLAICNNHAIRNAHNSFAKPGPSQSDENEVNYVWTFVNYVPIGNKVYEIDGMKEGPICIGDLNGTPNSLEWVKVVRPVLQERVDRYMDSEINFSVLAVVKNLNDEWSDMLKDLQAKKKQFEEHLQGMGGVHATSAVVECLHKSVLETNCEVEKVKQMMAMEDDKIKRWKKENERRKHNYEPFLFNFLKILTEKNKLKPLIEKPKSKNNVDGAD